MAPTRPEARFLRFSITGLYLIPFTALKKTNLCYILLILVVCYRSEYDGDLQSQLLSKANEEDKNCSRALSVVSVVVRAAKDLLHRAFAADGEDHFFRLPKNFQPHLLLVEKRIVLHHNHAIC